MDAYKLIRWFKQRRLRDKVSFAALLLVLVSAFISALNVFSLHEALESEKSRKTLELVETARSLVDYFHQQQELGLLSQQEAQQRALAAVGALRYNTRDYFWVQNLETPIPALLMHPLMPDLVGKPLDAPIFQCALTLQAGLEGPVRPVEGDRNLFRAFNKVIYEAGEGFVTYNWPKSLADGSFTTTRFPKLSYVRLYKPWGWVIGSGIFVDDLERAVLRHLALNVMVWVLLLSGGLVFVVLIHKALTPLSEAAAELDNIARGQDTLHPLPSPGEDEVGTLVNSFNRLQAALAQESRALKQNRALLVEAQKVARVGHLIYDYGCHRWTSSEIFDEIFGLPDGMLKDREALLDLLHPDDRDALACWLNPPAMHAGTFFSRQLRIRRADTREERWVQAMGREEEHAEGPAGALFCVMQDITARKLSEDHQRLTASVFANALEGIMITDARGCILEVNEAFSRITGYSRDEVMGKTARLLSEGLQGPAFFEAVWRALETDGHWSGEVWSRRKSGEVVAQLMNVSAVCDAAGQLGHYVAVFADITEIKEHQHRLERLAHFDALTGIPNRLLLADRMAQALAHARRSGSRMAICYLDLDGFKPVNDRLGHKAGDCLLVEVARRMNHCIRAGDTVARVGGDEFVVLLQGLDAPGEWEAGVQRLLQAIGEPLRIGCEEVRVSASIGVTLFPDDDAEADVLLKHADEAMYEAKMAGKERFCVYARGGRVAG